jgi:hypothetical protein
MPRITPTDRNALEAAPLIEERLQWSPSQPTRAKFKALAFAVVMVCAVGRGMAYEKKGERILAEADFSEANRFKSPQESNRALALAYGLVRMEM